MEQNTVQLESIIKMLMAGIAARGLRPESQENYTRICNSIRKYQRTVSFQRKTHLNVKYTG